MLIDGKKIAENIESTIKEKISHLKGRKPALAFILVGNDPASRTYIRMKKKKCAVVGIRSIDWEMPETTNQNELLVAIETLNNDPNVDGILLQLPLPSHLKESQCTSAICPEKDVDGFHPINMGRLLLGERNGFFPCTPYGIQVLLHHAQIDTKGQHVVIVGRSNIVGKPLAALLVQKADGANATVTVAHSATKNLREICRSADILVAAIGKPHFITDDMVKDGVSIIDVGINRQNGKIVGDVDFEKVAPKCHAISPVPGGVGPMTIAMLLTNTLKSYQKGGSI